MTFQGHFIERKILAPEQKLQIAHDFWYLTINEGMNEWWNQVVILNLLSLPPSPLCPSIHSSTFIPQHPTSLHLMSFTHLLTTHSPHLHQSLLDLYWLTHACVLWPNSHSSLALFPGFQVQLLDLLLSLPATSSSPFFLLSYIFSQFNISVYPHHLYAPYTQMSKLQLAGILNS